MNTQAEIRRNNLLKIADAYEKQCDLADAIGFTAGYASHLLTGHKVIGEKVARKIEAKLGLDSLSLDIDHDFISNEKIIDSLNTIKVSPDELCLINLLRDLTSIQRKKLVESAKEFKSENVIAFNELAHKYIPKIQSTTHAHA